MALSTLFGYTVEEDEGKIVITLTGSVAETLLKKYTADGVGDNPRLLSSLVPFGLLSSRPVVLGPRAPARKAEPAAETLDIKEIFGQGFDRSHTEFESQLAQYRDLLGTAPPAPAPAARGAAASPRKRSRRKK
jgi:hypothetical protein